MQLLESKCNWFWAQIIIKDCKIFFFPKKKLNEHKPNSLNSTLVPRLYKETLIINVKNEAKKYQPDGSEGEKVVENFYCLPYHKNIENRFLNKA